MQIGRFAWTAQVAVALGAVLLVAGCGSKPPAEADMTETPAGEQTSDASGEFPTARDDKPQWTDPNDANRHILVNIHFEFNKYRIQEQDKPKLEAIAALLQDNPDWKLLIEGHCDDRGTNEYNMGLGEQRAMATKNYLASLGVDGSRFTTISYGEERPLDTAQTEAAWSKNRRCQFRVEAPRS
ncbi:MAG: peptidoglycan-associated lipoprotein Pal [Candidatus Eiseniibacteriota bacterium]